MSYRRCRNPHRLDGPNLEQIVVYAIAKLGWTRKKVLSWVELENASLKGSRPRELVDRGQGELVLALLDKRQRDRLKEDKKRENKKNEK